MSFFQHTETDFGSKERAKKACEEFPKAITKEAGWRMNAVWLKVLETARALCLGYGIFETGTLYRTIRIEKKGTVKGEGPPFEVVYTSESEMISSEIVAGGLLINPKTGRICDYAQAVHDGHFTISGNWIPPRPFLRDAIYIHIDELLKAAGQGIDSAINTVWTGD